MTFHVPEKYRIKTGRMASTSADGNNGAFFITSLKLKRPMTVIASDGLGWEHVSVSMPDRTPTWEQMCFIKNLFWDADDCVIQFHPPKSEYINNHPHCLHLWRPNFAGAQIPMPDSLLVGIK